jgi:acetylornithine/N-succinyldiaminopimelate aminotransferase
MNREEVINNDNEYIVNLYKRFDLVFDKAKGSTVYDKNGREYIDFSSGIGCASLGYSDEGWVKAVEAQLEKFQHTSNLFYHEPGVELAKKLIDRTCFSKVMFVNSGAEANEAAIKVARKYGNEISETKGSTIVSLYHSFHGRTLAALTATGQEQFHHHFEPFVPGFVYISADDAEALQQTIEETRCCAVILELVQGEGGVIEMDRKFVQQVADICKANDMALILDEVQTGVGRTGTLFAYEQYGIEPDMITFAKGIAGGIPMGGVLCNEKYADVLGPGDHGSTFAMNPVASAGACYVLDTIDDDFLADVRKKADYMRGRLASMKKVKSLSGLGFMIGLELDGLTPGEACARILEKGTMTLTAGPRLRLLPPLNITKEEMDKGLARMAEVLD